MYTSTTDKLTLKSYFSNLLRHWLGNKCWDMHKRHLHLHRTRKKKRKNNIAKVWQELYLLTSLIFLCFLNFPFAVGRTSKQHFTVNHSHSFQQNLWKNNTLYKTQDLSRAATALVHAEVLSSSRDCLFKMAVSGNVF